MKHQVISFTTAADGSATVTGTPIAGLLYAIEWVDGDVADGVGAVISMTGTPSGVDTTLLTLTAANNDAFHYVRVTEATTAGAAGSGVTYPLLVGVPRAVVSAGGSVKSGKVVFYYIESSL